MFQCLEDLGNTSTAMQVERLVGSMQSDALDFGNGDDAPLDVMQDAAARDLIDIGMCERAGYVASCSF